jgi:toxin ParE1/3/4
MGVRRSEVSPSARMLIHGAYLIFYKTLPDTDEGHIDEIEVVRIVHGHRDLKYIF